MTRSFKNLRKTVKETGYFYSQTDSPIVPTPHGSTKNISATFADLLNQLYAQGSAYLASHVEEYITVYKVEMEKLNKKNIKSTIKEVLVQHQDPGSSQVMEVDVIEEQKIIDFSESSQQLQFILKLWEDEINWAMEDPMVEHRLEAIELSLVLLKFISKGHEIFWKNIQYCRSNELQVKRTQKQPCKDSPKSFPIGNEETVSFLSNRHISLLTKLFCDTLLLCYREKRLEDFVTTYTKFLEAIEEFMCGIIPCVRLPSNILSDWLFIILIPWMDAGVDLIPCCSSVPRLNEIDTSEIEWDIELQTKAIYLLQFEGFYIFQTCIQELLAGLMVQKELIDKTCISILQMIAEYTWPCELFTWETLYQYISYIYSSKISDTSEKIAVALAEAIVSLPCIYCHQQVFNRAQNNRNYFGKLIRVNSRPRPKGCQMCDTDRKVSITERFDIKLLKKTKMSQTSRQLVLHLVLKLLQHQSPTVQLRLVNIMNKLRIHGGMSVANFTSVFWQLFCRTDFMVQLQAVSIFSFCTRQKMKRMSGVKSSKSIKDSKYCKSIFKKPCTLTTLPPKVTRKLKLNSSPQKPSTSKQLRRQSSSSSSSASYSSDNRNARMENKKQFSVQSKNKKSQIKNARNLPCLRCDGPSTSKQIRLQTKQSHYIKTHLKRKNSGKSHFSKSKRPRLENGKKAVADKTKKYNNKSMPKPRSHNYYRHKYFSSHKGIREKIQNQNNKKVNHCLMRIATPPPPGRFDSAAMLYCVLLHSFHLIYERNKENPENLWHIMTLYHLIFKNLAKYTDGDIWTVELLKCQLHLLARCHHKNIVLLSQRTFRLLAKRAGCQPGQFVPRFRTAVAEEIKLLCIDLYCKELQLQHAQHEDINKAKELALKKCINFFSKIKLAAEVPSETMQITAFLRPVLKALCSTVFNDIRSQTVIEAIAGYSHKNMKTVLETDFPYYYPYAVLNYDSTVVQKFEHDLGKPPLRISTQLNCQMKPIQIHLEMLSNLFEYGTFILSSYSRIFYWIHGDAVTGTQSTINLIRQMLLNNYFYILINLESRLNDKCESIRSRRSYFGSYIMLMSLLGPEKVSKPDSRIKIYSTLNSLQSLGPEFHDLLCMAWKTFTFTLEDEALNSMMNQIFSGMLYLKKTHRLEVEELFTTVVMRQSSRYTLPSLHFLNDCSKDAKLNARITTVMNYVRSPENIHRFFRQLIDEIGHENSHIRFQAAKMIKQLLQQDIFTLRGFKFESEIFSHNITKLLRALLLASKEITNNAMKRTCAACIGYIGALDPRRFDLTEQLSENARNGLTLFTVGHPDFIVYTIEELAKVLKGSVATNVFDSCAYCIQEILRLVKMKQNSYEWIHLSSTAKESVAPLFRSKYQYTHDYKPVLPRVLYMAPVFGEDFKTWLSNWIYSMIPIIKTNSITTYFHTLLPIIKQSDHMALLVLPYVASYALMDGTEQQIRMKFLREVSAVLSHWVYREQIVEGRPKTGRLPMDGLVTRSQILNKLPLTPTKKLKRLQDPIRRQVLKSQQLIKIQQHHIGQGQRQQQQPINQRLKQRQRIMFRVKTWDENCHKKLENKRIEEEDNNNKFPYTATQAVFKILDHFNRLVRYPKSVSKRRAITGRNTQSQRPEDELATNRYHTSEAAKPIKETQDKLQWDILSLAALGCHNFARALQYMEQHLSSRPNDLDKCSSHLQRIYVALFDEDSITGLERKKRKEATIMEKVINNLSRGKLEQCMPAFEKIASKNEDLYSYQQLIYAYLGLNQFQISDRLIDGCTTKRPDWSLSFDQAKLEIYMKQNNYSELGRRVKELSCEKLSSWGISLSQAFVSLNTGNLTKVEKSIQTTRENLMTDICSSAVYLDMGFYFRHYKDFVKFQLLSEMEEIATIVCGDIESIEPRRKNLQFLVKNWKRRLECMHKSVTTLQPVIRFRKELLETSKNFFSDEKSILVVVNEALRDCYVQLSKLEAGMGNFDQAHRLLIECGQNCSISVFYEEAKLLYKSGKFSQSIKILEKGLKGVHPSIIKKYKEREETNMLISLEQIRYSKAKLLLAKQEDLQKKVDVNGNVANYRSAIEANKRSEKNHFYLGCYYDRLYSESAADRLQHADLQVHMMNSYCKSLEFGCSFIYQSLPRLMTTWFDYAAPPPRNSGGRQQQSPDSQTVQTMTNHIDGLLQTAPKHIFFVVFSQLMSRLCHKDPVVYGKLKDILVVMLLNYPNQVLWMMIGVLKSTYPNRLQRCKEIMKAAESTNSEVKKLVRIYREFQDKLIKFTMKQASSRFAKVSDVLSELPHLVKSSDFQNSVLVPFQCQMRPILPLKGKFTKSHSPFPKNKVFLYQLNEPMQIMQSLQQPKRITFLGSDGKQYALMCKPSDDLRKDAKVMEINNMVNYLMSRDTEARKRNLTIRCYHVVPLSDQCGILEWIPNLHGYRPLITALYKDGIVPVPARVKLIACDRRDPIETKRKRFLEMYQPQYPPVLSHWFLKYFNDPQAWYLARTSYIRTTAVMSIVGFLMGLGDRHGENILLDSSNGDIIHVDYNCLFLKGETFDWPERVPYRLTRNMTQGMGPLGHEGPYRRCCEIVMKILRDHSSEVISLISPFISDPLLEWDTSIKKQNVDGEVSNQTAVEVLRGVKARLSGTARNMTKERNVALSVEAHVDYLIKEATKLDNLCQMYIGWAAYL